MDDIEERYDLQTAAAWILGHAGRTGVPCLPEDLLRKTADECTKDEWMRIVLAGCSLIVKPVSEDTYSGQVRTQLAVTS